MFIQLLANYNHLIPPSAAALSRAIEKLYEVFDRYQLQSPVTGCDHCVGPDDIARLNSKALRSLSAADLGKYSWKAMTTWGDDRDFRHFLPRLFELLVGPELADLTDIEVIIGKLTYGEWTQWPAAERLALKQFLTTYWDRILAEFPSPFGEADNVLCAIANAEDELDGYLASWLRQNTAPAIAHLANFIFVSSKSQRAKLVSAFWDDDGNSAKVIQWLQSPGLSAHVESQFFAFEKSEPYLAAALSEASARLAAIHNWEAKA